MSDQGQIGQLQPGNYGTDYQSLVFNIEQALRLFRTASIVKVLSVTTNNQVGPSGFVDVQPLVNLVDGMLNSVGSHGTVHNLPFMREQSGTNGIINDPQVGDIGLAVICDRDISNVKQTQATAPPGSFRIGDFADGMYLRSFLTSTPTQYIQFLSNMLNIMAQGNLISLVSAGIILNGITIPKSGSGTGQSGTFTSQDGKTITVTNGIITGIV